MGATTTSSAKTLSGGCVCGAVRFTAAPESHTYGACHCDTCRRWTAGPFLSIDCADTLAINDKADLGIYKSSDWAERHFCQKCGTPLYYMLSKNPAYHVSIETFDDTDDFQFVSQIFIDQKPAHYSFANETKNMTGAETFAAFGSSNSEGA